MFYAVRLCGNSTHKRYMRPVEFVTENDDGPIERKTRKELEKVLKGWGLYEAGWVKIIEVKV